MDARTTDIKAYVTFGDAFVVLTDHRQWCVIAVGRAGGTNFFPLRRLLSRRATTYVTGLVINRRVVSYFVYLFSDLHSSSTFADDRAVHFGGGKHTLLVGVNFNDIDVYRPLVDYHQGVILYRGFFNGNF